MNNFDFQRRDNNAFASVPTYGDVPATSRNDSSPVATTNSHDVPAPPATLAHDDVKQKQEMPPGEWLTSDAAVDYLAARGVERSKRTIQRKCKSGGFSKIHHEETENGKRWFIEKDSLNQYLEEAQRQDAANTAKGATVRTEDARPAQRPQSEDVATSDEVGDDVGLQERIRQLESENQRLKREKELSDKYAEFVEKKSTENLELIVDKLSATKLELGKAKNQLEALNSPKEDINRTGDNSQNSRTYDHVQ